MTGTRLHPRHQLPARAAFAVTAATIALATASSAAPTPLYGDYAARWDFSTSVLTVVFGVYALGVLTSLLLVGRLSDELGRRPVLAGSLIGLLASLALFGTARSLVWLLAARTVQGLATGALLSAAGAALLDLEPRRDPTFAGLVNGVAVTAGLGLGAFVSAVLIQDAPAPRVTIYALLAALSVIALVGVGRAPETVPRAAHPRVRPQRPYVPAEFRRTFLVAATGVVSVWTVAGLYLALGPTLASELLRTHSHLAGGAAVLTLEIAATLGQVAFRRQTPRQAMAGGSLATASGMTALVASVSMRSPVLFLAASALAGLGLGVAFMGAVRTVSTAAPERHRAGAMAAFWLVGYLALAVPAVVAGISAQSLGIAEAFRLFGLGVVVVALLAAAGTLRGRVAERRAPCLEISH